MMIFIVVLYPKIELQSFCRSAEPVLIVLIGKKSSRKQVPIPPADGDAAGATPSLWRKTMEISATRRRSRRCDSHTLENWQHTVPLLLYEIIEKI